MKNAFFILSLTLLVGFSAQAQTKKKTSKAANVNVPENIKGSFATNYADVKDNKWSKNYTGNYVANFTKDSTLKQSLEYNSKGDLVKTTSMYNVNALPANITTALQTQYADARVVEASKVEVPGVTAFYKVKVERGENKKQRTLLISEEGTITE